MPVNNGPTCLTGNNCATVLFPPTPNPCVRSFRKGGVNDVYFIPCAETMSEANLIALSWWNSLLSGNKLGNIGIGKGAIARESITTEKIGSETVAEIVGMKWGLTYTFLQFDKTSADITKVQMDRLLTRFPSFQAMARMSDGDDTILPIGPFVPNDFNWIVPDDSEQKQSLMFKIVWDEIGLPKQYNVAGLSAVMPKAR